MNRVLLSPLTPDNRTVEINRPPSTHPIHIVTLAGGQRHAPDNEDDAFVHIETTKSSSSLPSHSSPPSHARVSGVDTNSRTASSFVLPTTVLYLHGTSLVCLWSIGVCHHQATLILRPRATTITSQYCTAVSFDTCTALARF